MNPSRVEKYHQRLLGLRARVIDEIRDATEEVAERIQAQGEISNLPTHTADRDSEGLDEEITLETSREDLLYAIDEALERIAEGTYGTCVDCGAEIPEERLKVLPYAIRCVPCAEKQENE